jgi:hypothetical protein
MDGNLHALSMVLLTRKLLGRIGVNPERLRIEWISAAQGIRFADVMNDVAKKFQTLGPLGKGEGIDEGTLKFKLEAARNLLPYLKLAERERLSVRFETEEQVNAFFASEEMDRLFRELVGDNFAISQIMLLLREKPLSVAEISERLQLNASEVTRHLQRSVRQGWVRFDESRKRFAAAS